ncbi:hypothetical protein VT06_01460 [Arsukibacterium sp. MJ3]|uniref:hypothetical protein n=1 Tax=Arsukibacterium sp. MJ3 TaxID=1632859 RepID=UPI000626F487|nr:hypothetical protein [Arsukibacterium sp. MJ3]KKO50662.1 hypothetical protein VT06_01460 [Arsukibacterium sp. MJ3]
MMTFFKYYMYLFSAFILLSFAAKITLKLLGKYEETPKSVQIEEYITLPLIMIGCVGMYGYVYSVTLVEREFWQFYAVLVIAHSIGAFWLPKLSWIRSGVSAKSFFVINFVGLSISLPFYIMIFNYAF